MHHDGMCHAQRIGSHTHFQGHCQMSKVKLFLEKQKKNTKKTELNVFIKSKVLLSKVRVTVSVQRSYHVSDLTRNC